MVNRNNEPHDAKHTFRNSSDRSSATRDQQSSRTVSDEIIVSLSNTYENKRARQVSEWERAQGANVRRVI